MEQPYWEVSDEKEIWLRTVGLESENESETAQQIETILDRIPKGYRCLEVGSGIGRLLKHTCSHFSHSLGADYSSTLVRRSVKYLSEYPTCEVLLTDGMHLPFESERFDFVYSYTVFHHMPTLEMVRSNLKEIYRVLCKGGLCRIQGVQGEGEGYDGQVYSSPLAFWEEFEAIGFTKENIELRQEPRDQIAARIWVTARKPIN